MRRIGELWDRGRLVTIVGAPGMGKTRLGIEVARSARETLGPDGVCFVELAPVSDPGLVASVAAAAAGIPLQEHDNPGVLTAAVGERRMLLVLDNCEHVLDASAHLVTALLGGCPSLRILVTSQERLSVTGERVWPLAGLAVPVEAHEADTAGSAGEAVELFDERARSTMPDFAVTASNLPTVVEICRRLDGIPLAIELAAARVASLAPAEIAQRLDDRFSFLTGGKRAVLSRHQTLRAAVDWSWDLLTETEQVVLRRLSVFAGGGDVSAIEAVCSDDSLPAGLCLDVVTSLVAKSLVVADSAGPSTRYRLLETIRLYGRDRLVEAGDAEATRGRHLEWYLVLAESAETHLTGPAQGEWFARLDADEDNLRAALSYGSEHNRFEDSLRLAGALAMFWRARSHFREGFERLDRALAAALAPSPEPKVAGYERTRAKALWGKALMAAMLGDGESALAAADESFHIWNAFDDAGGVARCLLVIGSLRVSDHSTADTIAILQRSIALARQVGDDWCLARALALCGAVYRELGDPWAARPVLEESVSVAVAAGDVEGRVFGLVSLGQAALVQGDWDSAENFFGASLEGDGRSGYEAVAALVGLAGVAIGRGDLPDARRLIAEASEESRVSGAALALEVSMTSLRLALADNDLATARDLLENCRRMVESSGSRPGPGLTILAGELALATGDDNEAELLLNGALQHADASGNSGLAAAARHALGDLARGAGDTGTAVALYRHALDLRMAIVDFVGVVGTLETLAGVAAWSGQAELATRVFGAAQAVRDRYGYARLGRLASAYQADVAVARDALGPDAFEAAWALGQDLSVPDAVALVMKGHRSEGKRPSTGVAALTDAERRVANLVLQRLSNAEIGERLFLSVNTVKSHVTRVFAKLDVKSRAELFKSYPDGSL